jgi:hypothetical protein
MTLRRTSSKLLEAAGEDDMMLLMTSSKLLQAVFPSCHDAAHDVIKAAAGRLPQLS